MEWGPCVIALKGLHLLTQSHQSSQSQMSSIMPHPAVIVDRVIPGFIRDPERIVKDFPVFMFCFEIPVYSGFELILAAMFMPV